jgi:hypothetical protein
MGEPYLFSNDQTLEVARGGVTNVLTTDSEGHGGGHFSKKPIPHIRLKGIVSVRYDV